MTTTDVGDPTASATLGGAVVNAQQHIDHMIGGKAVGVEINLPSPPIQNLHQLPALPTMFTGRADELRALRELIAMGGARILAIHGMSGVGKTALALKLAEGLREQFPDAQFFCNLRGTSGTPLSASDALTRVIRGYVGAEATLPTDEAELAALYRSKLDGQRALLLMNNARDAEQVTPLLPPASCLLLLTSPWRFYVEGASETELNALNDADAQALLLKIAPRIAADAAAIAEVCANLPLALTLASAWVREHSTLAPRAYVERSADVAARMKLTGTDQMLAVSYESLSADLRLAWRQLSVFPQTCDLASVAAVWGLTTQTEVEDQLSALVNTSLVEWVETAKRYRLHDLACAFAGQHLSDAERDTAAQRHAAYYGQALRAANGLYQQGGDGVAAGLAQFDRERRNIEAGQAWAAAHADKDDDSARLCSDYASLGWRIITLRLKPPEQIAWFEAARAAARRLTDRAAEAGHLGNLGNAYRQIGDAPRALDCYAQALTLTQAVGDRGGEGNVRWLIALAYESQRDYTNAIENADAALQIIQAIAASDVDEVKKQIEEWKAEGSSSAKIEKQM
ncbi:MAG: tetratricopeptide repeat protein [Chloroflexota bacterium]